MEGVFVLHVSTCTPTIELLIEYTIIHIASALNDAAQLYRSIMG